MFSLATKLYFGLAGAAFVTALGYRATTGERLGELIFFALAVAALAAALAVMNVAGQDLEPEVAADSPPDRISVSPAEAAGASPWPLVAAASAAVLAVTTVVGAPALAAGLIVALLATIGWTAHAWRAHPTFTPKNRVAVADRLVAPVAMPLGGFLVAASVAILVSRVLLHISEVGATVTFIVVATIVLTTFFVIAARPRISSGALAGLAAVAFAAVLTAGVGFASAGERPREHKGAPPLPTQVVVAQNLAFKQPADGVISMPAGKPIEIVFTNKDTGQFHNWAVYTSQDTKGTPIFDGKPIDHGKAVYKLTAPAAGSYVYVCDFHPAMKGEFVIR